MIEDLFKEIDIDVILSGLDNYLKIYKDTSPKRYWRKIRCKGKIKKTYITRYNLIHDLLPSPSLVTMMLRHTVRSGKYD